MGTGGRAQNLGLISSLQLCCLWRDDECPGLSWPIHVCNLQLWHYVFIHNLLTSAHKCANTLFWFEDSTISAAETVDRLHETCYDWLWRISSLEGRGTELHPNKVFLLCILYSTSGHHRPAEPLMVPTWVLGHPMTRLMFSSRGPQQSAVTRRQHN